MRKEKTFWGLFFILGAIFIIVSKLGYFSDLNVFSLILTVFFVVWFGRSLVRLEFTGICFSAAFLAIIYDDVLGITAITPWPVLGAALLGSIGFSMIFGKRRHFHSYHHSQEFSTVIDEDFSSKINFDTSFGSSIKYANSDDFQYANINCSFGSMKAYFDNAVVRNGNAQINLDVSFAGVELYIPKAWNLINNVDITFGGVDEKNKNLPTGEINVTLTGSASFSGITIIYV